MIKFTFSSAIAFEMANSSLINDGIFTTLKVLGKTEITTLEVVENTVSENATITYLTSNNITGTGDVAMSGLAQATNNATALAAGVPLNGLYRLPGDPAILAIRLV